MMSLISPQFPWLTLLTLLPLVAAVLIPFLPDKEGKRVRTYALGVGLTEFALMVYAFWQHYDLKIRPFNLQNTTPGCRSLD